MPSRHQININMEKHFTYMKQYKKTARNGSIPYEYLSTYDQAHLSSPA